MACKYLGSFSLFYFLVLLLAQTAIAAPYVNSGDFQPDVWDSTDNKWENGNPAGYVEGDTTAMVVKIDNTSTNQQQIDLCLEVENLSGATKYAFLAFNTWNSTHNPSKFPDGSTITISDTEGVFQASNINIVSVVGPSAGEGQCDPNDYGVTIVG
jgi:hypothetical protein